MDEQERIVKSGHPMPVAEETIFLVKCTIVRHLLETYLVDPEIFPDYNQLELPDDLITPNDDLQSQLRNKKAKVQLTLDRKPTKRQEPPYKLTKDERFKHVKRLAKDYLEDSRLHYLVYCDIALSLLELRKWSFKPFIGSTLHTSLQKFINSRMDNKIFQLFLTTELNELDKRNKELYAIIKSKRFQDVVTNEPKTSKTRAKQFQAIIKNNKDKIINQ